MPPRPARKAAGPVWVFDPQSVAREEPTEWWWNPLSYVTDEVRAAKLAEHFASGSRDLARAPACVLRPLGARPARRAPAGGRPRQAADHRRLPVAHQAHRQGAVGILQTGGYELTADQVAGVIFAEAARRRLRHRAADGELPDQLPAGLPLGHAVVSWRSPTPVLPRDFRTRGGGTLYSLSQGRPGHRFGPLVTALTVAVVEAAEELAARLPGGRLHARCSVCSTRQPTSCRWRELPNLYSHYGSCGIVLMTILQSWSQGVDVWGESGMKKLWSASNVAVYGGGVKEREFLEMLSALIGDYDKRVTSVSTGRGQRSVNEQLTRERILDVADLQAMPKGRAVVLASGRGRR